MKASSRSRSGFFFCFAFFKRVVPGDRINLIYKSSAGLKTAVHRIEVDLFFEQQSCRGFLF